jgi:hypothetical protein
MTDHFAVLNQPRRPWLDPEELKQRFHTLSARSHPDRFHQAGEPERQTAHDRHLELNTAYAVLREPRDRLAHLLELERGERPKPVQEIPPGMMDLFTAIGPVLSDTDALLAEKAAATSPLLQVRLMERALDWTGRIQALQRTLGGQTAALLAELQSLNPAWEAVADRTGPDRLGALPLERLELIHRTLGYLTRWSAQLQERLVQLSL